MQIKIAKGNTVGLLTYDSNTKDVFVDFPDVKVAEEVKDYFTTEHEYYVPVKGDDLGMLLAHDTVMAFPTDSVMFFELSLIMLLAQTKVQPLWETLNKET